VISDTSPSIDLGRRKSVVEIVGDALRLYARYPVLFATLALAVVVPYELIILATAGTSAFGGSYAGVTTVVVLSLLDLLLLTALISALHIHAVVAIGAGRRPRLIEVAKQGLAVLLVVFAAEIVAAIGITLGFALFVVPGVILALRWVVVAQVAATEHVDWLGALRRSGQLTSGNYLHVFGALFIVSAVDVGFQRAALALSGSTVNAAQIVLVIAVVALSRSFAALTTAVLYFDLRARAAGAEATA
jgi:hypothetical protein